MCSIIIQTVSVFSVWTMMPRACLFLVYHEFIGGCFFYKFIVKVISRLKIKISWTNDNLNSKPRRTSLISRAHIFKTMVYNINSRAITIEKEKCHSAGVRLAFMSSSDLFSLCVLCVMWCGVVSIVFFSSHFSFSSSSRSTILSLACLRHWGP